jgi:hypothetical protein
MSQKPTTEFERMALQQPNSNVLGELGSFLIQSKKWWLIPILLVLLLGTVLMMLSGSAVAPFIYPLF